MTHPDSHTAHPPVPSPGSSFPQTSADRWARAFVRFLQIEAASGCVLLVCAATALVLTNSPWADSFAAVWSIPLHVRLGRFEVMPHPELVHWINDALMTVFFFVVGLEIKRELVAGELRDPRKAALPAVAALGGMVVPAGIYLLLQHGTPGERGWGIPMATDIAFVVGVLALLGPRVPAGLKVLLLSLAIVDDIGAVLVIAVFYTAHLDVSALGMAAAGFGVIWFLNRVGVRAVSAYVVVGAGIWLAVLHSGVHATVAGVLLGLMTPASAWVGNLTFREVLDRALQQLGDGSGQGHSWHRSLGEVRRAAQESVSPLERLESALHPWVAYGIMPLFALANAGVVVERTAFGEPVAWAVAAGLVLGKPIGVFLFSALAVSAGVARLPAGVNWLVLFGGGCLAGIGFTMSLFIAGLGLEGQLLAAAKIGTLTGSVISAILGAALLLGALPARASDAGRA